MPIKLIVAGALLILSLFAGIWLRKLGIPLNTPVFTIHKLLAVAGIVVAVIGFVQLLKVGEGGVPILLLAAGAGLFAAGLIATGAVMSLSKTIGTTVLNLHRASTLLLIADMIGSVLMKAQK
ncbi:hypothetical protein AAFA46_01935 [Oscillospiraceae bacterium WX1]